MFYNFTAAAAVAQIVRDQSRLCTRDQRRLCSRDTNVVCAELEAVKCGGPGDTNLAKMSLRARRSSESRTVSSTSMTKIAQPSTKKATHGLMHSTAVRRTIIYEYLSLVVLLRATFSSRMAPKRQHIHISSD